MAALQASGRASRMSFSVDGSTSDTNEFWRIKIKYYFNEILDCNDDGKVGSDDFKLITDFYKGLKHIAETSQKYMDFERYIEKWKSNLLAGKEHISGQDFHKYCAGLRNHVMKRKDWPNDMQNYIDSLFAMIDEDNDGMVNLKDFLSIAINDEDRDCRRASWKHISGSSSGDHFKLSKESFDKLCKEFLTSNDPKSVGNWVFGTFDYKTYEKDDDKKKELKEKIARERANREKDQKAREAAKEAKDNETKSAQNQTLNETEKNALR